MSAYFSGSIHIDDLLLTSAGQGGNSEGCGALAAATVLVDPSLPAAEFVASSGLPPPPMAVWACGTVIAGLPPEEVADEEGWVCSRSERRQPEHASHMSAHATARRTLMI